MAKVTLHHYNWRKGREANPENMFNITLGAPQKLVQEAWKSKLYEPMLVKYVTDAILPTNVCERIFMEQNDDSPRKHRSMCVGDVVQIDEDYFLCSMMGFEKITL